MSIKFCRRFRPVSSAIEGLHASRKTMMPSLLGLALAAFWVGRWSNSEHTVKAQSGGTPLIQIQAVRGDSSLTVYYPDLKKLFVYQTPFVGAPTWGCSYSIQLSSPGGNVQRDPCPNPGQKF